MSKLKYLCKIGVIASLESIPLIGKFFEVFFRADKKLFNDSNPISENNTEDKVTYIEVSTDGRYQVSPPRLIYDTQTCLEWYLIGNEEINHSQVGASVKSCSISGGEWRLPTREELKNIYKKENYATKNLDAVFKMTSWDVWYEEKTKICRFDLVSNITSKLKSPGNSKNPRILVVRASVRNLTKKNAIWKWVVRNSQILLNFLVR